MKVCGKCLGLKEIYNGKTMKECDFCHGTGKTNKSFKALEDDDLDLEFGDD